MRYQHKYMEVYMRYDTTQLSKTMSHALRHAPQLYNLQLDEQGWVPVEALLEALHHHRRLWADLQETDLRAVMANADKQRFEIRDSKIRAIYGHSVREKIEKIPSTPPTILYHGTTPQAAASIRIQGLKPMGRQYVHLSADEETAMLVARRRTDHPVILKIAALVAHRQGITFYLGNDMVWLADSIPPAYIN